MRKLIIDETAYELATDPDYRKLTDAQADTLRLLVALAHIGNPVTAGTLVGLLGLQSALPLQVRLDNLTNKGLLRVAELVAA